VLTDASRFGTWVYVGDRAEALRRTECILVGYGQLSLGCEIDADKAPLIAFEVRSPLSIATEYVAARAYSTGAGRLFFLKASERGWHAASAAQRQAKSALLRQT
jgi:hypothetical protein